MSELTITYRDEPAGAREATQVSASSIQPFAREADILKLDNAPPQYATLEDGYWRLGSEFQFFPDRPEAVHWGLFSRQISGGDGRFATPITLILNLGALYSSVGLTLRFDPYGPTWCSDLHIKWMRWGTVIDERDFQPDDWQYICYAEVHEFDRVEITFRKMSAPYRFLKLTALTYGITRTFNGKELFGVDLYQDTDLISNTVSINTLDFTLLNRTGIGFLFQRRQLLTAHFGEELLSPYYIASAEGSGARYDIHAVDLVGLLAMSSEHNGGIYEGIRADVLAGDILDDIPWKMDEDLKGVQLYGHLPIANRRDNLQQLAFALGAMVCTGHRDYIEITRAKKDHPVGAFGEGQCYERGSIATGAPVSAVSVTAHSYVLGTTPTTLFEDFLAGEELIRFSQPMGQLAISGGGIAESGANYARIWGNGGTVILTGCQYTHVQRVYTKQNTLINASEAENPVHYDKMTLVSPDNVEQVLEGCFANNLRLETVKGKVLTTTERPGDCVDILTEAGGIRRGHLLSLDYTVSSILAADVEVLVDTGEQPELGKTAVDDFGDIPY